MSRSNERDFFDSSTPVRALAEEWCCALDSLERVQSQPGLPPAEIKFAAGTIDAIKQKAKELSGTGDALIVQRLVFEGLSLASEIRMTAAAADGLVAEEREDG